jgi:isopropylmalate/homocitrate/citramalate synthase
VLGKKSGIDSIRIKAEQLGLELDDAAERALLAKVKELGTKKRDVVTDDEFRELARG